MWIKRKWKYFNPAREGALLVINAINGTKYNFHSPSAPEVIDAKR